MLNWIRYGYKSFEDCYIDLQRLFAIAHYNSTYILDYFEPYGFDKKRNLIEHRFIYHDIHGLSLPEREKLEDELYKFIKYNFNQESEIRCTKNKCYIRMEI